MLLSIPRHRVSSVLGFLWPDKPLCPPTQQRLPSPMLCTISIVTITECKIEQQDHTASDLKDDCGILIRTNQRRMQRLSV